MRRQPRRVLVPCGGGGAHVPAAEHRCLREGRKNGGAVRPNAPAREPHTDDDSAHHHSSRAEERGVCAAARLRRPARTDEDLGRPAQPGARPAERRLRQPAFSSGRSGGCRGCLFAVACFPQGTGGKGPQGAAFVAALALLRVAAEARTWATPERQGPAGATRPRTGPPADDERRDPADAALAVDVFRRGPGAKAPGCGVLCRVPSVALAISYAP